MRDFPTLFKRAAIGQVVFLVWCLAFFGVDPLKVNPLSVQILLLLAAVVLLAGSFPGMFIARGLEAVGNRGARRLTVLFALGIPLLVLAFGTQLTLVGFRIYTVEPDSTSIWRLVFDLGMVFILAVSLTVNVATLLGPGQPDPQRSGP